MRGEQPVFVVTGRKEDVAMAKREILSAAEHFSLIRASRNKTGPLSAVTGPGTPSLPGQTTIQVSEHVFMSHGVKDIKQLFLGSESHQVQLSVVRVTVRAFLLYERSSLCVCV